MDEMLARFEACLDNLGVANKVVPGRPTLPGIRVAKVHLIRGGSDQGYALLYGPAVRLADAGRAGGADLPTLAFATFVAPKTAETFRRAGVQYLDTVGNAWIEFGDVLIDVRGRPRPDGAVTRSHVGTGNLFSPGRAQVVFALLAWPRLWDVPRREVAHAAGVSLGLAHNTLTLLAESGYGSEPAHAHQTELLDLWAAAFPTGLAKKLTLATYRGDIGTVKTASADDPVFVSGESAADELLRPAALTLYVKELDPRLPIVNRWRSDGPANIVVRRKFWHAPDNSDAPLADVRQTPWPLVYADLLASDDPRVRNTAQEWREHFAGSHKHA